MIVFVDMDDTLCAFSKAMEASLAKNPGIRYPQSQHGFFEELEPLPHALSAMHRLARSPHYSPYILTAPSVKNPLCYTEKRVWVEKHLGMPFVERFIICPDKSLLRGNYLIDDHLEGRGQEAFQGLVLHFGSEAFPDWSAILSYLGLTESQS